jgi:hypothetical protein
MRANQLRLWFASMAYVLLCALRRIGLAHTQFARASCGTIRGPNSADNLKKWPRVFFEAWDDPLISGIGWVSELVEIAGGVDIFANLRNQGAAKDRVVTAEEVVAREPDLIIGSWCGKKFRPERGDGAAYLRSNSGRAAPSCV